MPFQHAELPSRGGRRLTRLLARWADAHRPDSRVVEAIRQRVVAEPAPPDFDWWWRLLDPESGQAFRGLSGSTGWQTVTSAALPVVSPAAWAGPSAGSGRTHDDAEYQPYLRLT